ncbi:class GN sortase [Nitrogeniibacter aestuarii]|uniref:class GN sortase n=1 Tax=Nitrogeniibacter aestuarii TaxID=2815343 RepID=UPI001E3801B5|nr:class GN sortase [Nitrogeniibacter aestuarii]
MKTACHHCDHSEFLGVECAWPARECLSDEATGSRHTRRTMQRIFQLTAAAFLMVAIWEFGQAGYIHAKAWLAQHLIADAWERTLAGETQVKPWPWADTWPVARLRAPKQDVDLYVLAGSNGRTIAFGPGHVFGTAEPGATGNSVIGAHRDTHFAFLQWLEPGDELEVETPTGFVQVYKVSSREVVDKDDTEVLDTYPGETRLTLVTCYPFNAISAGGPLRYVVTADKVAPPQVAADDRSVPRIWL